MSNREINRAWNNRDEKKFTNCKHLEVTAILQDQLFTGYRYKFDSKSYVMKLNKDVKPLLTANMIKNITTKKFSPIKRYVANQLEQPDNYYKLSDVLPPELGAPGIPAALMCRNDITPGHYKEIMPYNGAFWVFCASTYIAMPDRKGWVYKDGLCRYIRRDFITGPSIPLLQSISLTEVTEIAIFVEYKKGLPVTCEALINNHGLISNIYNIDFRYKIDYDNGYPNKFLTARPVINGISDNYVVSRNEYKLIGNNFRGTQSIVGLNYVFNVSVVNGYYNGQYVTDINRGIIRGDIIPFTELPQDGELDQGTRQLFQNYSVGSYREQWLRMFLVAPSDDKAPSLKDGPSLSRNLEDGSLSVLRFWVNDTEVDYGAYLNTIKQRKQEFNSKFNTVTGDSKIPGIINIINSYSNPYKDQSETLVHYLIELSLIKIEGNQEIAKIVKDTINSIIKEIYA